MTDPRLPPDLVARVARTLAPVDPLPPPGRRALVFLALGALGLLLVPVLWGVRENAGTLGGGLWALSALQVATAALLFRRALVESIPGRLTARRHILAWAALGLALMLGVTAFTFIASPAYVPPGLTWRYSYTCSTRTFALGLPALIVAGLLLRRGLTSRPVLAGALAGLGSGLLADSSWRVFCEVSDPVHVLTTHAGGVMALCALGALSGAIARRLHVR